MSIVTTDKKKTNLIQTGNSKLKAAGTLMFNLPAGKITCGRVCVGCYALKEEARWPSVITARTTRLEASKQPSFVDDIQQELNKKRKLPRYFRIHSSGDFYSQAYIDKWEQITKNNPSVIFYAYTKQKRKFNFDGLAALPNFVLIDSLQYRRVNYGKKEKAPKGAFTCPEQKGSDTVCGVTCTYCQTKGEADVKGVWFVKH